MKNKPVQISDIKISEILNESNVDKVLDAILLAKKSGDENKEFNSVADSINKQMINLISKKLSFTDAEAQDILNEYYKKITTIINDVHTVMRSKKT